MRSSPGRVRDAAVPRSPVKMRWVLLGYVLLTLAVFRPTPYELAHTVPEVDGSIGDGLLYVWAIGHSNGLKTVNK